MSEWIFWALIAGLAIVLAVWETTRISRDARDYGAWTGLVMNLALAAFALGCLWGSL